MKNSIITLLAILISINNLHAQLNVNFEAEDAILSGTSIATNCNNASGGVMVKNISNGEGNAILFSGINIPADGKYNLTLSYYATSSQQATYKINSGAESSVTVPPSGTWCYQGGSPADFTFVETFIAGSNTLLFYNSPIIDKILISSIVEPHIASAFYISSTDGNDSNDGLSTSTPWKTIERANLLEMIPGDSLLFKSGDTFKGRLFIQSEGGVDSLKVVISSYGTGSKPVIDGDGYLSSINILNSGNIHLSNLEITNEEVQLQEGVSEKLRYGLFLENSYSNGTTFDNIHLENLTFINIYQTLQIDDNDQTGVNAYAITSTGSSWDDPNPARFRNILIENCYFTRTSRHALILKAVQNLVLRNNLFQHVGGAGIVVGANCEDVLIEYNTTDHTGSSIDGRMAGRGSGIWCFTSTNVVVQYNKLLYAQGIKDSYGMHIDYGNRNIVYQYNYSEGNEGGFVEILGKNVNIGYRYNVSIGDGWRKRGPTYGQIFWFSGWAGDPQNLIASDSIFVYNNSIYVNDTIKPGILISEAKNSRIYNNIIYAANGIGDVVIKNNPFLNDFNNNLWFNSISNLDTDGRIYWGDNAITQDPLFQNQIVNDSSDFILSGNSPAIGKGKLIAAPEIDRPFDYFLNHGGKDYFNNPVSLVENPNIGAYNGNGVMVNLSKNDNPKIPILLFPNPTHQNQTITITIPDQNLFEDISIKVFDLDGKIIHKELYLGNSEIKLFTEQFSPGYYMIQVTAENYFDVKQLILL